MNEPSQATTCTGSVMTTINRKIKAD